MKLKKILKNLHWSDKEIDIYLTLLANGNLTITEISNLSKINRITIYDVIENLISNGFVNRVIKNQTKIYIATDPKKVLKIEQKKVHTLEHHLPEFENLKLQTKQQEVSIYEGANNLNVLYDDINAQDGITKCFINIEQMNTHDQKQIEKFIRQRVSKRRLVYAILPLTEESKKAYKNQKLFRRQIKLLPENKFTFETSFIITNSKLYIIDYSNQIICTQINNPKVAKSFEKIFNFCWQTL